MGDVDPDQQLLSTRDPLTGERGVRIELLCPWKPLPWFPVVRLLGLTSFSSSLCFIETRTNGIPSLNVDVGQKETSGDGGERGNGRRGARGGRRGGGQGGGPKRSAPASTSPLLTSPQRATQTAPLPSLSAEALPFQPSTSSASTTPPSSPPIERKTYRVQLSGLALELTLARLQSERQRSSLDSNRTRLT